MRRLGQRPRLVLEALNFGSVAWIALLSRRTTSPEARVNQEKPCPDRAPSGWRPPLLATAQPYLLHERLNGGRVVFR